MLYYRYKDRIFDFKGPIPMNFNTLHSFTVIAESSSLSEAAERLNVSQPALSRTVKLMEEELGFAVFDHRGNSILLNDNGKEFLQTVHRIMKDYDTCLSHLREVNGIDSPMITISFSSAGNRIPYLTYEFRKLYPQCHYTLKSQPYSPSDNQSNFFFKATFEPVKEKNFLLLTKEPLFVTLSENHPLAHQKSLHLGDLGKEIFLFPGPENDMYDIQMHYCRMAGFSFAPENMIEKPNVLISLIRLNMGIALYPPIRDENLVQIPISDIPCFRYVYLIRNSSLYQSRLARAFEKFTIRFFKSPMTGK